MSDPLSVQLVRTIARLVAESDRAGAWLHLLARVAGTRQTQVAKVLYAATVPA